MDKENMQEFTKDGLLLSNDKNRLNLNTIYDFMSRSYWAAQRKQRTIAKSLDHSLCYGIYHETRQIAFARVVTDYSTFAYLCDVFVDEEYRGKGLSKWMMNCIMDNPHFSELRRFLLATKDAHALYEKYGFKRLTPEEGKRYMSILKDGV